MELQGKYKKGEDVFYVNNSREEMYRAKGKILGLRTPRYSPLFYLVEFYEVSGGSLHSGNSTKLVGKKNSCWWCREGEILNKAEYFEFELSGEE